MTRQIVTNNKLLAKCTTHISISLLLWFKERKGLQQADYIDCVPIAEFLATKYMQENKQLEQIKLKE